MKDILLSVNNEYTEQAEVLIYSIFKHNTASEFCVHIFESDLARANRHDLKCAIKASGADVLFHHMDKGLFRGAPERDGISTDTYYRLLASDLLPSVDKILYLDADIIVNRPISELFETRMEDYCIAGIEDQGAVKTDVFHKYEIGLKRNSSYINGGVLLMNLKGIRRKIKTEEILKYIYENRNRLKYQDQDIINALFQNEILILPETYNKAPLYSSEKDYFRSILRAFRGKEDIPAVIHYMGEACKPWRKGGYGYKYYRTYKKACLEAGCIDLYRRVSRNGGLSRLRSLKQRYDDLIIYAME